MKNIYKNIYSDSANLGDLSENPRVRIMLSITDSLDLKAKNILDIGCYDGTFLSLIKNRNNSFFGIEASDWGVKKTQEKGINVKQFFFNDKNPLPFEDNFFDCIIAGEIIEHIYDTDFFLSEIRRVLKPEGKLLISTPNLASFGRRLLLFFGINPIIEISPNQDDSSGHIRYFTVKSLNQLLKKHHFKVVQYKSDHLNFSSKGSIKSSFLARIFPKLGTSIIVIYKKLK